MGAIQIFQFLKSLDLQMASISTKTEDITTTTTKNEKEEEQFCLKWNDFDEDMADSFKSLREEKAFCDVTISAEGQKNEKHPIIILKDVSFLHMSAILEFMYHGEVSVTQEELPAFLKTAEKLEIKGLAEDEKEGGEMSEVVEEISTAELEEAEPKFLM